MFKLEKTIACLVLATIASAQVPLIVIPGLGDACGSSISMVPFCKQISEAVKNPVQCVDPANGSASITTSWSTQISKLCEILDSNIDKYNLKGGFYIMGLSQGGLLARAAIETCQSGQYAKKLITLGGPHMGVIRVPHTSNWGLGWLINLLTDDLVYTDFVQNHVGPAGYFHSLKKEQKYLQSKAPLPDLNNERDHKTNAQFKSRLSSIDEFIMVMFSKDTMIIPKETAHFGFFKDESQKEVLPYNQTNVYSKIGLDALDKKKALFFYEFAGNHLDITDDELKKFIFPHLDQK